MNRTKVYKKLFFDQMIKFKEKFTDIVLIAVRDNTEISAHRFVLSVCSPYFVKLFTGQKQATLRIANIDGVILKNIIHFCYTGHINITEDNVNALLDASHLMEMKLITQQCDEYLSDKINTSNCFRIIALAKKYDLSELLISSTNFIYKHFEQIYKSDEFSGLDVSQLTEIIKLNGSEPTAEEHLFYAIKKWINYDLTREIYAEELLKQIQIFKLKKDFITSEFVAFCSKLKLYRLLTEMYKQLYIASGSARIRSAQYEPKIKAIEKEKFVAISKQSFLKIYIYSVEKNCWIPWNEFPVSSSFLITISAVVLKKNIFIIDRTYDSCGNYKNAAWSISLDSKKKQNYPVLPKLIYYTPISLNDDLYLVGKHGEKGFNRYDFTSNKWIALPSMSLARKGHSVVASNLHIYVIGGYTNDNPIPIKFMERYDFVANKWIECCSMNTERTGFGAATLLEYIYVAGGIIDGDCTVTNTVERYDPNTNTWTYIASINNLFTTDIQLCVFENNLYAAFDRNNPKTEKCWTIFEMYDSARNRWKESQRFSFDFKGLPRSIAGCKLTEDLLK